MKLSGKSTKEIVARLIRNEFDKEPYEPQYLDRFIKLINTAGELELYALRADMIRDLEIESRLEHDTILRNVTNKNQ